MRVLAVLEAGEAYPSGVVRGTIYRDLFREHGFEVTFVNRLPERLLKIPGRPSRAMAAILAFGVGAALSRLAAAFTVVTERQIERLARDVDVVYMSKVTSLPLVKRLRAATRAPLVLDFGDALWLGPGGAAFNELLGTVDAVTTDNSYTAEHVRQYNPHCTVIPDAPQIEQFDAERGRHPARTDGKVRLGWIGTPSSLENLYVVRDALEQICRRRDDVELRIVGGGYDPRRLPRFEHVPFTARPYYSQAEMIQEVLDMDIGLFPLYDTEAAHVRGVLKATVYMSGEAVVVASPIGQTVDLIADGVDGMLAATPAAWEEKLEWLIENPQERHRIADTALAKIRSDFAVARSFAILRGVLHEAVGIARTDRLGNASERARGREHRQR